MISFHIEASGEHTAAILSAAKKLGIKVGLALKPKTPLTAIEAYLKGLDYILVMSVEPGFSGQEFMPEVLEKVRTLRHNFPELDIEIDGGISAAVAKEVIAAGANILVSGAYLFSAADPAPAIAALRQSV